MKTVAYLPGALKTLEQQLAKSLGQFYDQFTVEEWYVSSLLRVTEAILLPMPFKIILNQNYSKDGFRLNNLLTQSFHCV